LNVASGKGNDRGALEVITETIDESEHNRDEIYRPPVSSPNTPPHRLQSACRNNRILYLENSVIFFNDKSSPKLLFPRTFLGASMPGQQQIGDSIGNGDGSIGTYHPFNRAAVILLKSKNKLFRKQFAEVWVLKNPINIYEAVTAEIGRKPKMGLGQIARMKPDRSAGLKDMFYNLLVQFTSNLARGEIFELIKPHCHHLKRLPTATYYAHRAPFLV